MFEPIDKKQKIYAKKAAPTPQFQLPVRTRNESTLGPTRQVLFPGGKVGEQLPQGSQGELNAQREADRLTVNRPSKRVYPYLLTSR